MLRGSDSRESMCRFVRFKRNDFVTCSFHRRFCWKLEDIYRVSDFETAVENNLTSFPSLVERYKSSYPIARFLEITL